MTKVNSRQVYAGHGPLKLSMTLIFRAWQDPQSEVIAPIDMLLKMSYPAKIANDIVEAVTEDGEVSVKSTLKALFPSEAPKFVKLFYKGESYPPLVIESISKPLDAPYSPMGDIWQEVNISLSTLESLDYSDIQNAKIGKMGIFIGETINKATSLFN